VSAVRPRRVVHDGSVLASGIVIDTLLVGETEARARIVRLSEAAAAGSAAFRVGSALVLRLPAPARMNCAASWGTPLVRYGRLLSAAPLAADEEKALDSFEDAAVLVTGGVATATRLRDDIREDISQWIDVSEFRVVDGVLPLGRMASEAPREQVIASVVDVRRSLGMAPLDKAGGELLAALAQTSGAARPGRGSWLGRLVGGLAGIRNAWRGGTRSAGAGAVAPTAPATQRQSDVRRSALRDFLARALWSSKLANLIGRQHARYLSRMLAMFDDGDLDAALRHAIPLGKGLDPARLRLPLWTPAPRNDLSVTPQQPLAGTSLGVGTDLFSYLRQRYRQAYERLAAAGEIEKAAFVLAELLDASEEAVLFLERHGRLRLAAEIAETRNLPAGLVIRQWFLAGERARAIAIARRTGAFADAVVRLEGSHREQATVLRLLWADALASGGLYAAAVDAAWPVEAARNLALGWIDRAIEIGGATGARMLARKARLRPEEFTDIRERALALLADESEEARSLVIAFAQELTIGDPIGETRILARAAARRLLRHRDEAAGEGLLNGLVRLSGDAVFQADVRSLRKRADAVSTVVPLRLRHEPIEISRRAGDRGSIAVCDAAQMPDGRMLVAAGEVGAWLLSPEGKMMARFAEPASRIVASDHGDRAILIATRGEVCRLSRLDLLGRRLQPWCDARIDRFAPDFDGLTWFVARGGTLYAVDATAPRFEHLWKVDEAGAVVREVRRSTTSMSAWFEWLPPTASQRARPPEVWTYELPSLTLRRRQPVEAHDESLVVTAIGPEGDVAGWTAGPDTKMGRPQSMQAWCLPRNGNRRDVLEPPGVDNVPAWSDPPCLTKEWALFPMREAGRVLLHLLDMTALQVRARISLEGEMQTVGARFQGDRLIVFDGCGRVLAMSLTSGAVVREYRL
jgi:hypothetical protein